MQIKMTYMLVYWNMYYISMFIYYLMLCKPEWPDFSPQLLPILLHQETSTNNTSELEKGQSNQPCFFNPRVGSEVQRGYAIYPISHSQLDKEDRSESLSLYPPTPVMLSAPRKTDVCEPPVNREERPTGL